MAKSLNNISKQCSEMSLWNHSMEVSKFDQVHEYYVHINTKQIHCYSTIGPHWLQPTWISNLVYGTSGERIVRIIEKVLCCNGIRKNGAKAAFNETMKLRLRLLQLNINTHHTERGRDSQFSVAENYWVCLSDHQQIHPVANSSRICDHKLHPY